MTVKELIEKLQEVPDNYRVVTCFWSDEDEVNEVIVFEQEKKYVCSK